jgi:hypothetical protein
MDLATMKEVAEIIYYLAVSIGGPVTAITFLRNMKKDRKERQYKNYTLESSLYLRYLEKCLEHPNLDVLPTPQRYKITLTREEEAVEETLITSLFVVFEQLYLLYCDEAAPIRKTEWTDAWEPVVKKYVYRDNFIKVWELHRDTFNNSYGQYITKLLQQRPSSIASLTA